MLQPHRRTTRLSLVAVGVTITLTAAACGGDSGASAAKVATLGTTSATSAASTDSSTPANNQDALLAYAKCMRDNGIDMADPTFDANGNPTGGIFGRDSGIDRRSAEFQTAQAACGDLIKGITFGGRRGGLDRKAVEAALNDFTACLRDHGQNVDDITFGNGQGPAGGGGGFGGPPGTGGSTPGAQDGATPADGSVPAGGFGGPPPTGDAGGAPGGGPGFNRTNRIIERLGLDPADPTVTAAIAACQSILDSAFQPTTTTTG